MPIGWEKQENGLLLYVSGELDHHGVKGLIREMEEGLEREGARSVTVDLSGVTFMDSSGIALLLRVYRRAEEIGGRVTVCGTPEQAMKVLKAAGLPRLMRFE